MSHEIIEPIDQVLSTEGTEWHGLARLVTAIDTEVAKPLFFNILELPLAANLNHSTVDAGGTVTMSNRSVSVDNRKALIAHFVNRDDLVGTPDEYRSLHVPSKRYPVIPNCDVWREMEKAIKGIGAKVTCIGTLDAGRKFFISVRLADGSEMTANNDKFLANLNFITSHDGTLGVKAYDSLTRIVCMNTLRASLASKGELGFSVYHTAGAVRAMGNLGDLVNDVLTGRASFRNAMEYLAAQDCTADDALLIALGYFAKSTKKTALSTRTENSAKAIADLFTRGIGNRGRSLYDLLNGATEYWTSGEGTGKKGTPAQKASKAAFGEAADHKEAFWNYLMSPDSVVSLRESGRAAKLELARLATQD